jgi:hypothetical protein
MWLFLALLSIQDIRKREVSLQSQALLLLFTAFRLPWEQIFPAFGFWGLFLAPMFFMDVMGGADLVVELALMLQYFQPFPGLLPLFLLFNYWFVWHARVTNKSLPYIPIISILSWVALNLPTNL